MDDQLYEFLAAHDLDDLPDGAWQQMIMDAVVEWNEENGDNLDAFETWLTYCEQKAERQTENNNLTFEP